MQSNVKQTIQNDIASYEKKYGFTNNTAFKKKKKKKEYTELELGSQAGNQGLSLSSATITTVN